MAGVFDALSGMFAQRFQNRGGLGNLAFGLPSVIHQQSRLEDFNTKLQQAIQSGQSPQQAVASLFTGPDAADYFNDPQLLQDAQSIVKMLTPAPEQVVQSGADIATVNPSTGALTQRGHIGGKTEIDLEHHQIREYDADGNLSNVRDLPGGAKPIMVDAGGAIKFGVQNPDGTVEWTTTIAKTPTPTAASAEDKSFEINNAIASMAAGLPVDPAMAQSLAGRLGITNQKQAQDFAAAKRNLQPNLMIEIFRKAGLIGSDEGAAQMPSMDLGASATPGAEPPPAQAEPAPPAKTSLAEPGSRENPLPYDVETLKKIAAGTRPMWVTDGKTVAQRTPAQAKQLIAGMTGQ